MKQPADKELDEMLHKIWACKTKTPVGVIWTGSRAHLDSFITFLENLEKEQTKQTNGNCIHVHQDPHGDD